MIAAATAGARKHDRPVTVCGGLAADVTAAAILIGLGVTELSAPPAILPEIKTAVRRLTMASCQVLAARALDCASAADVRALLVGEGGSA
jgi:phosphoenolpyruvate-protein kinase (PTS system EI component)